jgi:hypothetical protein
MNKGLVTGLNTDTWRYYTPKMIVAGNAGGLTQPIASGLGPINFGNFARYHVVEKRFCIVEFQYTTVDVGTLGSGGSYAWNLPLPARRWSGDQQAGGSPSGCVIGSGMAYITFANVGVVPNINIPLAVTLADPFISLAGDQDSYFQAYAPYITDWGTDTVVGGSNTKTTNHTIGFAFNAQDITLNFLDANTGLTASELQLTSITSTQFTIIIRGANASAGGSSYSYKIRAEPPTGQQGALCSPTVPYDAASKTSLLSPFASWHFAMIYEIA